MPELSIAGKRSTENEESSQQHVQRLWLVRHGATAWNLERRFMGHSDFPLSPLGHTQARWVGRRLRLQHITAIYSRPLQPTHEPPTIIPRQSPLQHSLH